MLSNLSAPKLILNKAICEANIEKMASKIKNAQSTFRPHFKTHNSEIVADWFKKEGITKITVTSPEMALKFINKAWKDITIAMPFNPHWISFINAYAHKITFNLIIEDTQTLIFLENNLINTCNILLKIDLGSHRTGINPDNKGLIDALITIISNSKNLSFKGFLGHAGHTYKCSSTNHIKSVFTQSAAVMKKLKETYIKHFPEIYTSYGDTPSCSIVDKLKGFDEYRPGNFVFYDLMQLHLNACSFEDMALAVACPVIAKHPERNEIIVHCGAIHLSKDYIEINNEKIYGEVVTFNKNNTWRRLKGTNHVIGLSQEHGIIKATPAFTNSISIGQSIGIIPVHSCLTAFQMQYEYHIV